jgi:hypothetical protein
MQMALADTAAQLYAHACRTLIYAAREPPSQQRDRRLRRATVLHHLMPALITTTDGAPGVSRVDRIGLLVRGDLERLLPPLIAHARVRRRRQLDREETDAAVHALVMRYMDMPGGLKKAAQVLQPGTLATPDDASFATMQAKHPPAVAGEQPDELRAAVPALIQSAAPMPPELELLRGEDFADTDVARCVQRANFFSGAGPSGLRYSHLQDALRTAWGRASLPTVLAEMASLAVHEADRLPDLFWELHTAARLTPVVEQQPDGTPKQRPITCGEVMQRLVGSLYVSDRREFLAEMFEAHGQGGVAVQAGAEKGALAGKLAYQLGHWQIALDLRNAFNSESVKAMGEFVAARIPDLLPYFTRTYMCCRPRLLFRHADGSVRVVTSQRGVKQGDPLGPLLFCGGIAPCLERFNAEAKAAQSPRRVMAYMDDNRISIGASTLSAADMAAVQRLTEHFAEKGLEANFNKTHALPGRGHVVTGEEQQLLQQLGIAVAGGVQEDAARGMVMLGVPVGNDAFAAQWLQQEAGAAGDGARFAKRVAGLQSQRAMYRLLRHSVVPRVTYMLRTVSPDLVAPVAAEWDHLTHWVLERCMGLQPPERSWEGFVAAGKPFVMQEAQLRQARLPAREGGLGIADAAGSANAAFVGAMIATLPSVLYGYASTVGPAAAAAGAAQAAGGAGAAAAAAAVGTQG